MLRIHRDQPVGEVECQKGWYCIGWQGDWGRAGVGLLARLLYSPTHSYHSVVCVQKPKHDKLQALEMSFSLWFDLLSRLDMSAK